MDTVEAINTIIAGYGSDVRKKISDKWHTFEELYEHRYRLFIALCGVIGSRTPGGPLVWRSKLHSDGTMQDGNFIMGIFSAIGRQITYHLPLRLWADTDFCVTLEMAPIYDGHTSKDVLNRLEHLGVADFTKCPGIINQIKANIDTKGATTNNDLLELIDAIKSQSEDVPRPSWSELIGKEVQNKMVEILQRKHGDHCKDRDTACVTCISYKTYEAGMDKASEHDMPLENNE